MKDCLWNRTKIWTDKNGVISSENWEYRKKGLSYSVTICYRTSDWGELKQVSILKNFFEIFIFHMDDATKEPTMKEKLNILENTNAYQKESEIALEVFPAKKEILDIMDMYHLWILKKDEFPFYIDNIPCPCDDMKKEIIGEKEILFNKRNIQTPNGEIEIYFLQSSDGSELEWYDKQNFKDEIVGNNKVAVEFIQDVGKISILIVLPENIKTLPFGLGKREASK